jgi:asparagine synthase (glutamine-hydrolysing)
MFAFAIYDKPKARLFLARDRFGEKPLYYWANKGLFGFASEVQALQAHPRFDEKLSPASLRKFFAYGFVPSPHSLWTNCAKLPGGWSLTYDLRTERIERKPYWQFGLEPDDRMFRRAEGDLAEELRGLLDRAVSRRLLSDVPLGVFLSGGIDSSAALAFAAKARGRWPVDTFTIGFNEPSFDESAFARQMSEFAGSQHHEQILSINELRETIDDALHALDEPLADPSIVPTYLLSKFTRQNVTVALSGDGGDELFAGYDPFKALSSAQMYEKAMPRFAHSFLRKCADMLPRSTGNMSLDFKLRRTLAGLSYQRALWNPVWLSPVEPRDLPDLFGDDVRVEEVFEDALGLWRENAGQSLEEQTLLFYTRFYLQDNILVKVDRAAMASSLETRAVFLDNDVVDFARRLPYEFKYRKGQGKYLLRKSLEGLVPSELLQRGKKGFGIPVSAWLRDVPKQVPMQELDRVDLRWVQDRWAEHRGGKADHRVFLWSWLSAQSASVMRT